MTTVDIRTVDGETNGSVELPADIFDAQASIPLLHQVVVAQLAAARQGTHKAKTRGEVEEASQLKAASARGRRRDAPAD